MPYIHLQRSLNSRCLAHIINLATQALIATRSKSKYYNPNDDDQDTPSLGHAGAAERDEVGLVRAITVKVRTSLYILFLSLMLVIQGSVVISTQRGLQGDSGK